MPHIVHWNPRTALGTGRLSTRVKVGRRINNFGDLLGPLIVERVRQHLGLGRERSRRQRLLTVGSIMHFGRDGDVVWGTGVNGKVPRDHYPDLDIRAVRGPLSAEQLQRAGVDTPGVFGDPALLLPLLWDDTEWGIRRGTGGTVLVPNLHDREDFPSEALDPRSDLTSCIRAIASADLVVSSSLHGIAVAEAYGVPAVLVASRREPAFKYEDYYLGTGRQLPPAARTWREATTASPAPPISHWRAESLLAAFPSDLWAARSAAD